MQKNLNIEKITFKVVQMKFLAMHITNQKLSFDIFTVRNLQNIFMEHDLNDFWLKRRIDNLTHTLYCWLLLQICDPGAQNSQQNIVWVKIIAFSYSKNH